MGRKTIDFDKESFVELINTVEGSTTMGAFKELARLYNEKHGTNIKTQMFYLRAKQWELSPRVNKGSEPKTRAGTKPKKVYKLNLSKWPADQIEKYKKTIAAAERGSYKASMKLRCVSCSNFIQREVRLCPVDTCEVYHIRPYRR
jgi:DNA-binding XRE family transcriptional regulator